MEDACRREVREETSVELNELALVGVYSDLNRDPRGHIVSIAYTTLLPSDVLPRAGSDATSAEWIETSQVTLGLDHAQILADAKAKIFSHIRSEGHDAKLASGRADKAWRALLNRLLTQSRRFPSKASCLLSQNRGAVGPRLG